MADYKVIIVGAGASGLLCAVELLGGENALSPSDVLLLEANERVGKKLVATGNGQGNFANENFCAEKYHGDRSFISAFVQQFNEMDLEGYFASIGIPLCTADDGKKYPVSKQANSALDIIRMYLAHKGCKIVTDARVQDVKYVGGRYQIKTSQKTFYSQNTVLAFGGKAGKQFGTDGTSYHLAQNFSHNLTELYPSLVQLKTPLEKIKGLKGQKEYVTVSAYDGDRFIAQESGELLFTEYGISGSAVFYLSSRLTDKKNPNVKIEFLPQFTKEQVADLIKTRLQLGYFDVGDCLVGILNKKIGQAIVKNVESPSPEKIASAVKNFRLKITGNLGFNYAQVTKGGIDTNQINPFSMQSKLQKGLYIIGEALNVDGDCGGYNLSFAFATGIICARYLKENC